MQEGVRHDTRNFEAHKHSAAGERCVLVVDDDRLSSSASSTARPSTSCSLPRLSGRQLAKRLGAMGPEMKVLFMSGYPDGTILHLGVLDSGVACLQKPLTPASLARGVSEVLRGS